MASDDDYKKTALAILHTIFDNFEILQCDPFCWRIEVTSIEEPSFATLCRMWHSEYWAITVGPSTKQGKMVVQLIPLSPST